MLYVPTAFCCEQVSQNDLVPSHRRYNSHRDIAVKCGLRFDLADDAVFFGEEKGRTVRKVKEHLHPLGALEQIGYFRERLSLRSGSSRVKFQASAARLRIICFDS
jgi:hypothetical protein